MTPSASSFSASRYCSFVTPAERKPPELLAHPKHEHIPPSHQRNAHSAGIFRSFALIVALSIIVLHGCATTSVPPPQIVRVPVATPCIEKAKVPAHPAIVTDTELAALNDFYFVIKLATERLELKQYAKEAHAVISACTR